MKYKAILIRPVLFRLRPCPCALQDADECIRLAPDFAKGYSRKGHLQFFMKEYEKALETYDTGLKHDPTNSELKEGRQRTMQAVAQVGAASAV
jgi:stress-induced-phosphoprotein 1